MTFNELEVKKAKEAFLKRCLNFIDPDRTHYHRCCLKTDNCGRIRVNFDEKPGARETLPFRYLVHEFGYINMNFKKKDGEDSLFSSLLNRARRYSVFIKSASQFYKVLSREDTLYSLLVESDLREENV